MKILFVSDTYYPHLNGVYYFVCRIGPILKEMGHEIAVIAPSETRRRTLKRIDELEVYGMPSLPALYYPKVRVPIPLLLGRKIDRVLNGFRPDVIHIQDHFLLCKTVVTLGKARGIPIVATNHFMPENLTALLPWQRYKEKVAALLWSGFSRVFNRADIVTTPTETAAGLIRPRLTVPVKAISSGVDLQKFNSFGDGSEVRKRYSIPDGPILLFVGRLDPEKKLEDILRAVAIAAKQVDFTLVLVGRGISMTSLRELAKELGIEARTIFTGFVPEEDLPSFYKMSYCFIIASTAELLSLATLQAMASGLPVIAVKAGALGELVRADINGFLFDAGDIRAMARYVCDLMVDDRAVRTMSLRSQEMAFKHDIQQSAVSFERVYEDLVDRKAVPEGMWAQRTISGVKPG
jgi:glycosyltransferase involved in cell wall biosynthesis